jgi:cation:H+ antiporter
MSTATLFLFLLGLLLLIGGAELLVRGASRLAAVAGISRLVIGLTVVAYGTGSPEFAVSMIAALTAKPDIAAGNVVGSNIFNVLFILGLSALLVPLIVSRQVLRREVPVMIGSSLLLWLLALDGKVGRLDGALLLGGLVVYTLLSIRLGRKEAAQDAGPHSASNNQVAGPLWLQVALVVAGLALLVLGSHWLVNSSIQIARFMGVSDLVIGLTIVAAGTSLPEVATSVLAAIRSERDISLGNVVGSNIFNILGVLGASSLAAPGGLMVAPGLLAFDIPVMVAVAFGCMPIFFTGHRIARWEGGLFFAYYAAYTAYLILQASVHDALPWFSSTMGWFVIPLTAITLLTLAARAIREKRPN